MKAAINTRETSKKWCAYLVEVPSVVMGVMTSELSAPFGGAVHISVDNWNP